MREKKSEGNKEGIVAECKGICDGKKMHSNGGGKEGETLKQGKNQSIGNTHKYEMTIITLDKDTR